MQLQTIVSRDK